jgi:fructokinase
MMQPCALCFGEVLWDCLPTGRVPGGAPLNVAYHLHRLGADAKIVSAVGRDALGDEMLACLRTSGVSTELVARHAHLPTGTVGVELSAEGQPSYTIEEGVAWDEIPLSPALPEFDALIFGSLAARSAANRAVLDALLAKPAGLRFMDVNLRPPFDDRGRALALASRVDWVKVNEEELRCLTGSHGDTSANCPQNLAPAAEVLSAATGDVKVCATCGERGAFVWDSGTVIVAPAPRVRVRDTIGAGDAFTAAFVHGLLTNPSDLPRILERACALGALVASLPGGQPDYDLPR